MERTLRPWHSEVGEEKVITIQREDRWIYEMNTKFLSSFETSNQESASSSQALTPQNIEKGIDEFEPSTSDALSSQQRGRLAGMTDEEEDDEDEYNLQPLREKFVKRRVMN